LDDEVCIGGAVKMDQPADRSLADHSDKTIYYDVQLSPAVIIGSATAALITSEKFA